MKDKIILWLDGDISTFGIATYLQEKYDCDLYAIIDITDRTKKFFQEQTIVKFNRVWYYHDSILSTEIKFDLTYLSSFEKKYKINLWILAHNERLFYRFNEYHKFSSNEIISILEQECKLFESILEEVKPDFLIIKTTDLHHNHLFYEMCKANGVKVMMLEQSRFGYKCMISQERDKLDFVDNLTESYSSNRTIEELQNYLKTNSLSSQLTTYKNRYISSKWKKFKAAIQFILISNNSNIKTHYTYYGRTKLKIIKKSLINVVKEKYREFFINKNLLREINNDMQIIYFPLHQEPERVLLIGAPFYTNQIETIRHIAKSLPIGYKLYVKEHPTQSIRGWRQISDYKEIMNIPNVKLIHPSVPSEEIMKKSSLIITVGGTAGLEAAFYQKPSIIFTDMSYAVLPSVYRLKRLEELPEAIRLSLQKKVNPSDLDKYLNILERNSFEFDYTGFQIEYVNEFFYGGHLADVDIPVQKMESFLEKHRTMIEQLGSEYIKKIKQHKEYELTK